MVPRLCNSHNGLDGFGLRFDEFDLLWGRRSIVPTVGVFEDGFERRLALVPLRRRVEINNGAFEGEMDAVLSHSQVGRIR